MVAETIGRAWTPLGYMVEGRYLPAFDAAHRFEIECEACPGWRWTGDREDLAVDVLRGHARECRCSRARGCEWLAAGRPSLSKTLGTQD